MCHIDIGKSWRGMRDHKALLNTHHSRKFTYKFRAKEGILLKHALEDQNLYYISKLACKNMTAYSLL